MNVGNVDFKWKVHTWNHATPILHILYTQGVLLMPPRVLASGRQNPAGAIKRPFWPAACLLLNQTSVKCKRNA